MKKYIILILSSIIYNKSQAQISSNIGVKTGINISQTKDKYSINSDPKIMIGPGYYLGGFSQLSFKKDSKFKINFETILNYHSSFNKNSSYHLGVISIPIGLLYNVTPKLGINTGLVSNVNILGKSKNTQSTSDINYKSNFQSGIYLGFNFILNKNLFINTTYTYNFGSFVNYKKIDPDYIAGELNGSLKYQYLSIGIGITI